MLLGFALPTHAQDESPTVRFYSEIAAPYYWIDKENTAQGVNVDLTNALIEQTNVEATLEHLPWARAVAEAVSEPNVVLLSVLRTPSREATLHWLGKVSEVRASLVSLAHRTEIKISTMDDARHYRVGTIRGYGAADYLLRQGFSEQDNLVLVSNIDQLWSLLFKDRLDLVLTDLATGRYELKSRGLRPQNVVEVFEVSELNLSLELATGQKTSAQLSAMLADALADLKQSGQLASILRRWDLQPFPGLPDGPVIRH
ncbi:substrate-binding periplasmic protein [Aestuariibacter salexigens]|uniref:substrate-binding periplasmic protein n=1 Tax=Aestuariibacter salexigens TaxID=226010 RepID=UPI00040DCD46|nr:transporter substrate-binding domain-containing protein [Aestuariibacter salexigens]